MINLSAGLNSTGYGVVATNIFKEFWKRDDGSLTLFPIGNAGVDQNLYGNVKTAIERVKTYNSNLPGLKIWHQHSLADRYSNTLNSALTFFELDSLSDREVCHLSSLDVLFVASKWAQAICNAHDIKSVVIPMGVDTDIFFPAQSSNGPYKFFTTGKIEIRKGHDILCDLFNRAFSDKDDVELLIKWRNPFLSQEENYTWQQSYLDSPLGHKIKFFDTVAHSDVANFIHSGHCGICPTRAEGFGLGILEAIACDKPVITTDYSAITEFCNDTNAKLVKIDCLESAYDGRWFNNEGQWAHFGKEQEEQFIAHMRYCYNNRITTNPGREQTLSRFNWKNCVDGICLHLGLLGGS